MPYLNLDLDYFSHPKTNRLIGLLGRGSEAFPLRLWCYCGKYHPGDGRLSDYSVQEIESVLGWCGESGKLVQALMKVGFLHKDTKGYYVHDWLEHEGHLDALKERAKNAAKARWDKYKQDKAIQQVNNDVEDNAYAQSNAQAMPKQCLTNAPYHTIPNQTKKEENTHSPSSLYNPQQSQQNSGRESDSSLKEKSKKSHKSDPLGIQLTTQNTNDVKKILFECERFIQAYPKKVSKRLVEEWFLDKQPTDKLIEQIHTGLQQAKKSQQWQSENGRYIPKPINWLNDEGWRDEYQTQTQYPLKVVL